ncbi:MAG: hypothetical protein JW880_00025 [Candidatus Thermoplasmatota archaeon]|nr:hypothetical protein [Candidatus Thermoplasmatota archaeon]
MKDIVEKTAEALEAWSAEVKKGEGTRLMDAVMARASAAGVEVLVLDGAMVFGKDHLKSALRHAARAIEEGTNSSQSRPMETLLYASGERQLSSAIKKMAVSERTEEVVVARLTKGQFEPEPTWTPVPDRHVSPDRSRLLGFGISATELDTVEPGKASELVLERVAAVDILKK